MIPYGRQDIDESDIEAVVAVLRGDWLTTGPSVDAFEAAFSEVAGSYSTAVTSGTAALHVAYKSAGIGLGDEIITPPITFIATQATAMALGAGIKFADVQSDTGNSEPGAVGSLIPPRTKAVVAVDYAGHRAELDELRSISDRHGLILIEDAAHSIGSLYRNRKVGAIADLTTFSFFPTKNVTTGEGGAVASPSAQLTERARAFRNHGLVRDRSLFQIQDEGPWHQEVHEFGLNYRLPDILAALGTSQLRRLAQFKQRRTEITARYNELLSGIQGLATPVRREYVDPMWHLYSLRILGGRRRQVFEAWRSAGVGVQVNYIPAYWHPAFQALGYKRGLCPVAEQFYQQELSLPLHPGLSDEQVEFVAEQVRLAVR